MTKKDNNGNLSIMELIELVSNIVGKYLTNSLFRDYTGQLVVKIHLKSGNICNFDVGTSKSYNKNDLDENKS